jgi:hypothetical protein
LIESTGHDLPYFQAKTNKETAEYKRKKAEKAA